MEASCFGGRGLSRTAQGPPPLAVAILDSPLPPKNPHPCARRTGLDGKLARPTEPAASGLLNSSRGTASRRPGTIIIIICRLSTMPHHHDGRGEGVTGGRSAAPSPASPSPARAFSASRPPPPGGRQVCRLSRMMRGLRDPRQAAFAVRRPASSISRWRAIELRSKPFGQAGTPHSTNTRRNRRRRATARPSARLRRERRKGRARPRGRSRSAPRSVQRLRLRDLDEFDHSNGPLSPLNRATACPARSAEAPAIAIPRKQRPRQEARRGSSNNPASQSSSFRTDRRASQHSKTPTTMKIVDPTITGKSIDRCCCK